MRERKQRNKKYDFCRANAPHIPTHVKVRGALKMCVFSFVSKDNLRPRVYCRCCHDEYPNS